MPDAMTVMDCDVAPVLQRYEVPALAVSVTLPPLQNVVGPDAVIVAAGIGLTVTVAGPDVAEQPATSKTVTV